MKTLGAKQWNVGWIDPERLSSSQKNTDHKICRELNKQSEIAFSSPKDK